MARVAGASASAMPDVVVDVLGSPVAEEMWEAEAQLEEDHMHIARCESRQSHLQHLLSDAQLRVAGVAADGNCLFHAMCHFHRSSHSDLRMITVDELELHWEDHAGLCSESKTDRIARMRRDGEFAELEELHAASAAFQVHILVYQVFGDSCPLSFGNQWGEQWLLCWDGTNHFDAVVPAEQLAAVVPAEQLAAGGSLGLADTGGSDSPTSALLSINNATNNDNNNSNSNAFE